MKKLFIDTNIFLRFLLKDIYSQWEYAYNLFSDAQKGKFTLITSTLSIFEVYWILEKRYGWSKEIIITSIEKLLKMTFLEVDDKHILNITLQLFKDQNISLVDSYNCIKAIQKECNSLETFDIKLKKLFSKLQKSL